MNNGCICCAVRGGLIRAIQQILKCSTGKRKLDGIIIETTGIAVPCKLDSIIVVVDAKHTLQHLLEVEPEGIENENVEQVAFADRILLNKTDLVISQDLDAIKKQIRSINASVQIVECQHCRVDPSLLLLNIESFDLDKILVKEPDFLENTDHVHDTSVTSVDFQSTDAINVGLLQDWIQEVFMTKGNDLLRRKGVINVAGMDNKFVFQGVHMLFDGGFVATKWKQDESRETRFVFIGKNHE